MSEHTRDNPNVVIFPPLILLIGFGLAILLEWLLPITFLAPVFQSKFQTGFSAILALTGISVAILGVMELRKHGTNVEPHKPALFLVHSGVYALTRNPIYVGMVTFFLGVSVFWNLEWGVILTLPVILTLHYGVIKREEAYLGNKFGAAYLLFRKNTRRWL
ncbi:methyltransferase [Maritalea sp.]|jgi:protein-S-isoprenylcysteine O-methyltransferase Ste14|uniref:methyltransferase family protein n=1 Tax=Maritalea sp. TaxID=2003361 RepID=UPI0039E69873